MKGKEMLKDGKKAKLTLNQTWRECIRMWKWIVKNCDGNSRLVEVLKAQWLKGHGYTKVDSNCFFCEYDGQHTQQEIGCPECPGKLADKRFSCGRVTYSYIDLPKKFLKKLLELDAKRRGTTR